MSRPILVALLVTLTLTTRIASADPGALLVAGGVSYASGIVLDIALAGSAADAHNRQHDLHLAPLVSRTATSGQTVGLGVTGSF